MSIRAMNWAMAARTDGVSAQCVLYVVADTANEHGVTIHADPDYIAARTRQSRATVFRRLKELEATGALTRFKRYRDDGAPVYEIRLHMDRDIDYERAPDTSEDAPDVEPKSQIETQSESQIATGGVAQVRQAESQSCDSMSPSKNPEDSPPTPQGGSEVESSGDQASEQGSEQASEAKGWPGSDTWPSFEAAYSEPILRQSIARQVWSALSEAERGLAIRAAKGYVAHRRAQKKPPNVINAHTFLRERDAWAGFALKAPAELPDKAFVPERSREFAALRVLALITGEPLQARFDTAQGASGIWRYGAVPDDLAGLAAFADKPIEQWGIAEPETRPFVAWAERIQGWTHRRVEPQLIMLAETVTHTMPDGRTIDARKRVKGLRIPCPWPPRKDGTISPEHPTTGPPKDTAA